MSRISINEWSSKASNLPVWVNYKGVKKKELSPFYNSAHEKAKKLAVNRHHESLVTLHGFFYPSWHRNHEIIPRALSVCLSKTTTLSSSCCLARISSLDSFSFPFLKLHTHRSAPHRSINGRACRAKRQWYVWCIFPTRWRIARTRPQTLDALSSLKHIYWIRGSGRNDSN
jgi:hypothetical protein